MADRIKSGISLIDDAGGIPPGTLGDIWGRAAEVRPMRDKIEFDLEAYLVGTRVQRLREMAETLEFRSIALGQAATLNLPQFREIRMGHGADLAGEAKTLRALANYLEIRLSSGEEES